jgi:hypothetical protein
MVRKQTRRRKTRRMRGGNRIYSLLLFLVLLFGHFSKVEGVNWGRLKNTLITIGSKLNDKLTDQQLTEMSKSVVNAWNADADSIVLPDNAAQDAVEEIAEEVKMHVYVPANKLKDNEDYIYTEPGKDPVNITVDTWKSTGDGSIVVSISYPNSGTINVKQGDKKTFEHVERPPQDPVDGGKRISRRKTLRRKK